MTQTAHGTDTRTRIVDVASRLLREEGPAAVTTRGVAEGAGVQAPTIYRLFGDKDGLLEAVAEHVMATFVSSKAAVVEAAAAHGVDPFDDLRAGWDAQIDFGLANPTLFAFLSDPARGLRSPAAQRGLGVLQERVRRVAATGRLRVSEQRAVDVVRAAGVGTITTLLATPVEHRDHGLADAMYEAVLGQVLTDPPADAGAAAHDDVRARAVAFRAVAPGLAALSDAERHLMTEWLDRAIGSL